MSTALPDQVKIAALNTEHPGHFADLIAANLNLSARRPPAAARNRFRPRAAPETAAAAQPRAGSADVKLENPERRRLVHRQDAARFFPARTDARHPARTRRRRPQRGRNQVAARKNRPDADARGGAQGRRCRNSNGSSRRRPPPPNTALDAITSTGFWPCRGKRTPRTSWI